MLFSLSVFFVILLIIFLSLGSHVKEYARYRALLNKLPGPKRLFLLGNIPELRVDPECFFKKLRKWSREHYPVYGLSASYFGSVNISGPDEFEVVASSMKNIEKSQVYLFLERWLGEGLLTSTGSKWQIRRKILTPAFHFSILQDFLQIFNEETQVLVDKLISEDKSCINVVPLISQFTLNSIAVTAMGITLDTKNEEDKSYVGAIQRIGKLFYYRITRPWTYLHTIYYNTMTVGFLEKNLIKTIHNFTNKIIKIRSKNFVIFEKTEDEYNYSKRKKLAMLDLLLNAKIADGLIDDKGIQDEVNTFMFEGYDTTSMSICFTLMVLAYYENVQEKVYQEILEVIGDTEKNPSLNQLNELKYMERVIKESLRLYPSVPFISRLLEEEVPTKLGYTLPKGVPCHIHIYDIHRDPEHWPDPEKFDPDRFLAENCVDRHPFCYVPFSAGPRNCIGQRFALLEIKAVLSGILRTFLLEPIDNPNTIVLVPDMVLRTANETIRVNFVKRK